MNKKTDNKRKKRFWGFTLIELLVVIAIIMILMAALVPNVQRFMKRSKTEATQARINELEVAIASFYNDVGEYPRVKDGNGWLLYRQITQQLPSGDNRAHYWHGPYITLRQRDLKQFKDILAAPSAKRPRWYSGDLVDLDSSLGAPEESDYVIIDAWENPIFYYPTTQYKEGTYEPYVSEYVNENGNETCYNLTTFQLYSFGNDRMSWWRISHQTGGRPYGPGSLSYNNKRSDDSPDIIGSSGDDLIDWEDNERSTQEHNPYVEDDINNW